MNDYQIETLVRKAPDQQAPDGLLEQLKRDIRLPIARPNHTPPIQSPWRRWFPALSFGVLLLGCFIALAVQTNQVFELGRENESLRAGTATLDQLRQDNAELQRLSAMTQDADRIEREHEELLRLRGEVARLRAQVEELAALRAENQHLQAERATAAANAGLSAEEDPLAAAQEKAKRIQCVNNLKQVGLAARIWASDHQDALPTDFVTMSNELSTPKLLLCPADTARKAAYNWQEFGGNSVSYQMLSPGAPETDPEVVYVRCSIHNNVGLVDGSVQQINPPVRVEKVDGKFKLVR
ncbi:MAG: hypothetical protein DME26_20480 [Verrucomicrobia bacterium]|nr:MAG: hypothetical protein DME26_20480 [Verrucomicrobiota bacterium]